MDDTNQVSTPEYVGFWKRVGAYVIDALILTVINLLLIVFLSLFLDDFRHHGKKFYDFLSIIVALIYFPFFESSEWQCTPGKKAFGLIVVDEDFKRLTRMKALVRYIGKIVSALILCIGFIMIAFTENRQGLHDKIAGTFVIKK